MKGGSVSSGACAFEIFQEEEQKPEIHAATPKEIVVSSRKPLSSRKREEVQDPFYSKTVSAFLCIFFQGNRDSIVTDISWL